MFCLELSLVLTIHAVCDLQLRLWVIADVLKDRRGFETSVDNRRKTRNDLKLQQYCCENFKSLIRGVFTNSYLALRKAVLPYKQLFIRPMKNCVSPVWSSSSSSHFRKLLVVAVL